MNIPQIVEMYRAGSSTPEIAKTFGVDKTKIRRILLAAGEQLRTQAAAKKRNKNHMWSGYQEINGWFWNSIRASAKRRNIPFELTIQQGWDLFIQQGKRCSLSGLPLKFAESHKDQVTGGTTASLDRIDSKKGYTLDNVQWVHKYVNIMKSNLQQCEFINICKLITERNI